MKKILITGATGLIGQKIVANCKATGIAVHYLTTQKHKIHRTPAYHGFYWNPKTQEIDANCFAGVNGILHLAGATVAKRWSSRYKKEILDSRVQSTKLLYDYVSNENIAIDQFISASAIGIYPSALDTLYTENEPKMDSGFLGDIVQKWEAEVHHFKAIAKQVCLLRIGLVLSNQGGAYPKIALPIRLGVGSVFGKGNQWQSWIHVDDLARMFLFAWQNKLKGTFNAVATNPVTHKEMVHAIAAICGKKIWLPNTPKLVLKTILGEMHSLLFMSQRVSCAKIEKQGFLFNYPEIRQAIEALKNKERAIPL